MERILQCRVYDTEARGYFVAGYIFGNAMVGAGQLLSEECRQCFGSSTEGPMFSIEIGLGSHLEASPFEQQRRSYAPP